MTFRQQWLDFQTELDREDIVPGHSFECREILIGNGSKECPMLDMIGVDRHGRFWVQRESKCVLIFNPQIPLACWQDLSALLSHGDKASQADG